MDILRKISLHVFCSLIAILFLAVDASAGFRDMGTNQAYIFRPKPTIVKKVRFSKKVKRMKKKFYNNVYRFKSRKKRRAYMYKLSNRARNMKLPKKRKVVYLHGVRAYNRNEEFFNVKPHKKINKRTKITFLKVEKLKKFDPDRLFFLHMEQRFEALLALLSGDENYANVRLWTLANLKESTKDRKARDSFFAGIAAFRRSAPAVAFMGFLNAIDQGIEVNPKYLESLLKHVGQIENQLYVNTVVKKIKPKHIYHLGSHKHLDRVYFTMAMHKFGKQDKALAMIERRLTKDSVYGEKIQLIRALRLIENRHHKNALTLLESLTKSSDRDLQQQATINLARLFALFHQYEKALELYRSMDIEELNRLDTLLEIAWLEYESKDYNRAVGKSVGLQSPYFAHAFVPEVFLLEAYGRKKVCDFGGSEHALDKLKTVYGYEMALIRRILKRKKVDRNYQIYADIKDAFRKEDDLNPEPKKMRRYERYLLQIPFVNESQRYLYSLQKDYVKFYKKRVSTNIDKKEIDFLVKSMLRFYLAQKAEVEPLVEKTLLAEVEYLNHKLTSIFQQLGFVKLDIVSAADTNQSVASVLNYPDAPEEKEEELESNKSIWPFENEFWEDELAWLKLKGGSRCVTPDMAQQEEVLSKK